MANRKGGKLWSPGTIKSRGWTKELMAKLLPQPRYRHWNCLLYTSRSFWCWRRSGAVIGLFRNPCTCPDLETFFRKMLFHHIFPEKCVDVYKRQVQGSVAGQGEVQQGVGPPLLVGGGAVVDLIAPAEVEVQGPLVLLVDGDLGDVAVRHPPAEELGPQPGAQVLRGQEAVSYTHLDVYKRQACCSPRRR